MSNSTENDRKRGKEDLVGNFGEEYHEFQLERTKFLSLFHSLIETTILFPSDLTYLQESIKGWVSEEAINGPRTKPHSNNLNR